MCGTIILLLLAISSISCCQAATVIETEAGGESEHLQLYAANDQVRSGDGGRSGQATDTNSCADIRDVPSEVRSEFSFPDFYQKYTEAYGIPVVSSSLVSDAALQRACYTARFLLADWYSVRNSVYQRKGRFVLIAKSENLTDVPEYSHLPESWDSQYRGAGANDQYPLSTASEENAVCEGSLLNTVFSKDMVLHEYAHMYHLLGTKFGIANFQSLLSTAYKLAKASGRWSKYALSNENEYFAEALRTYFTRFKSSMMYFYDRTMRNFLQALFPCNNKFIQRCEDTKQEHSLRQKLKINYPLCKLEPEGEEGVTTTPSTTQTSTTTTTTAAATTTTAPTTTITTTTTTTTTATTSTTRATTTVAATTPTVAATTTTTADSGTTEANPDCIDQHESCQSLAIRGKCSKENVKRRCQRSCVCNPPCFDLSEDCERKISRCDDYVVKKTCARTCGHCTTTDN